LVPSCFHIELTDSFETQSNFQIDHRILANAGAPTPINRAFWFSLVLGPSTTCLHRCPNNQEFQANELEKAEARVLYTTPAISANFEPKMFSAARLAGTNVSAPRAYPVGAFDSTFSI
jgi:hypothetical protein